MNYQKRVLNFVLVIAIIAISFTHILEQLRRNYFATRILNIIDYQHKTPELVGGFNTLSCADIRNLGNLQQAYFVLLSDDCTDTKLNFHESNQILPDFLITWAIRSIDEGSYEKASDMLEIDMKLFGRNRDNLYYLGVSQALDGDFISAFESWKLSIAHNNGRLIGLSDIYFQIGHTYRHRITPPQYEDAMKAHLQAIEEDDYKIQMNYVNTLYQIGTVFQWRGEFEKAKNQYLKVLAIEDDHYWALIGIALVYIQTEQVEIGVNILHRAIRLFPEEKAAYKILSDLQ